MSNAYWLADVLRAAGVPVVEEGDWANRGTGGTLEPRAVMVHHDASPGGNSPSAIDVIIGGRSGLPGPLSQLWLDYHGVWHVIAAGRANHAGEGVWGPIPRDAGNTYAIGIETDHTTAEPWTPEQRDSGIRGLAALCAHLGVDPHAALCGHKEYATPPGRKVDPDPLDMDALRAAVAAGPPQGGTPDMTPEEHEWLARIVANFKPRLSLALIQATGADGSPAGAVYLTDGNLVAYRWVQDPTDLVDVQHMLQSHNVNPGLWPVDNLGAFGALVGPEPPAGFRAFATEDA